MGSITMCPLFTAAGSGQAGRQEEGCTEELQLARDQLPPAAASCCQRAAEHWQPSCAWRAAPTDWPQLPQLHPALFFAGQQAYALPD